MEMTWTPALLYFEVFVQRTLCCHMNVKRRGIFCVSRVLVCLQDTVSIWLVSDLNIGKKDIQGYNIRSEQVFKTVCAAAPTLRDLSQDLDDCSKNIAVLVC